MEPASSDASITTDHPIMDETVADKSFLAPMDLLQFCQKEKRTIKVVSSDVQFNSNLELKDISLATKGDDEDKIFADQPYLYKNLRRGNTLMLVLDEAKKAKKAVVLRKGLRKFFDVYLEYLEVDEAIAMSSWVKTNKHFNKLKAVTLDPIQEAFSATSPNVVHIYRTGKANGENAQVSYNKEYDAWAVSSKNVCLLARTEGDLSLPGTDIPRYQFSRLIGASWFLLLSKLSSDEQAKLKEYMNNKTFVAEYCGNQEYQHLVKYSEIDLHFYAIVENDSTTATCIPPDAAYEIFKEYRLTTVSVARQTAASWKDFNEQVFVLYKEVGKATIEESGEGAVLYFVCENTETKQQHVLSLCKLKTLEYRILRKLREKLKCCLADKKGSGGKWMKRFSKEITELCEFCPAAKSEDHYNRIAATAFEFLESSLAGKYASSISSKFITFLDMITKAVEENTSVTYEFLKTHIEGGGDSLLKSGTSSTVKNKRILLVTPPFYLTASAKALLISTFGVKGIGKEWKEGHSNVEVIGIENLNLVPRITSEKLNRNNVFIFLGWSEKRMEYLKKQIDDYGVVGETPDEIAFAKANNIKKMFTLQLSKIKEIKMKKNTLLPTNSFFLDDVYEYDEFASNLVDEEKSNQKIIQTCRECLIEKEAKEAAGVSRELEGEVEEEEEKKVSSEEHSETKKATGIKTDSTTTTSVGGTAGKSKRKRVAIILPITVPATGKTTFFNKAIAEMKSCSSDVQFYSVSSDIERKSVMDELKAKNAALTDDELFAKSTKQAKSRFENKLMSIFDAIEDNDVHEKHIVIFDKNHPPQAITSTMEFLNQTILRMKGMDVKIVALTPRVCSTFEEDRAAYPFSLTYFLNCIDRCLNREGHETLVGEPYKLASVIIMFFKLFKNVKLTGAALQKQGFQKLIEIPFHHEVNNSDSEISKKVVKKIEQVFKNVRANEDSRDSPYLADFVEAFYSEKSFDFKPIEFDEQFKIFKLKIDEILGSA